MDVDARGRICWFAEHVKKGLLSVEDCFGAGTGSLPLRVTIIGLLPIVFSTRCKAVCDPVGVAGVGTAREQIAEYMRDLADDLKSVEEAVDALHRLCPDAEVELVNTLSLRGLAISIRHRLGRGTHALFNDKKYHIPSQLNNLIQSIKDTAASSTKSV